MSDGICFAGLDVHARKTAAAAVRLGSGEVFKAQIAGAPVEAIGWLQSLPGPVRAVYEAGPTGFGPVPRQDLCDICLLRGRVLSD